MSKGLGTMERPVLIIAYEAAFYALDRLYPETKKQKDARLAKEQRERARGAQR